MDREVKVRIDLAGKTDFSQAKQDLAEIQEKVRDIAADTQKIDISPVFGDVKANVQEAKEAIADPVTQKVQVEIKADDLYNQMLGVQRRTAEATKSVVKQVVQEAGDVWDEWLGKSPARKVKPTQTQATEIMKEVPEKETSKTVLANEPKKPEPENPNSILESLLESKPTTQAQQEKEDDPTWKALLGPASQGAGRGGSEPPPTSVATQPEPEPEPEPKKYPTFEREDPRQQRDRREYIINVAKKTIDQLVEEHEAATDKRQEQIIQTQAALELRKRIEGKQTYDEIDRDEAWTQVAKAIASKEDSVRKQRYTIDEQEAPEIRERSSAVQRESAVNAIRTNLMARQEQGDYREASLAYRSDPESGYQATDRAIREREIKQALAEQLEIRKQLVSDEEGALRQASAGVQAETDRNRILRERLELTARLPFMREATQEQREFMRSPEGRAQTQNIANVQYEKQQAAIEQDKAMRLAMMRAEFGRFGGTLKYAGEEMKKFGAVSTATFMGLHASMLGFASAASPAVMQTATGSMQLLMGQIGIMFIPAIVRVSYHIQNVARWIGSWSEGTKSLVSNAALAATAVISVGWAFGTLFRVLGTATEGIFGLISMFRNAGGGLNNLLPRPGQVPEAPGAAQPGGNRPGGGQPANNAPGSRQSPRPAQAFRRGGAPQQAANPAGGGANEGPPRMGFSGGIMTAYALIRAMGFDPFNEAGYEERRAAADPRNRPARNVDAVGPQGPLSPQQMARIRDEQERLHEQFDRDNPNNQIFTRQDGNEIIAGLRRQARANILGPLEALSQGQNVPAVGPQGPLPPNRIPAAAAANVAANAAAPADPRNPRQERPEIAYSLNFQSSQSDIFAYRQQMQIEALKDPLQREISEMQLNAMRDMVREIQTLNQNIRMR